MGPMEHMGLMGLIEPLNSVCGRLEMSWSFWRARAKARQKKWNLVDCLAGQEREMCCMRSRGLYRPNKEGLRIGLGLTKCMCTGLAGSPAGQPASDWSHLSPILISVFRAAALALLSLHAISPLWSHGPDDVGFLMWRDALPVQMAGCLSERNPSGKSGKPRSHDPARPRGRHQSYRDCTRLRHFRNAARKHSSQTPARKNDRADESRPERK